MKAISLWQPWASAVAVGAKRVETRSWATGYRGPLAIHAARRFVWRELCAFHSSWNWTGALWALRWGMQPGLPKEWRDAPLETKLPFGAVVAVCELVDCRPTDSFTVAELKTTRQPDPSVCESPRLYQWNEGMMGDFTPGRFGWVLADVRAVGPIPAAGRQGLWEWEKAARDG
jgi:activating signal cointegrator 1